MKILKKGAHLILCETGGPGGRWLYEQKNAIVKCDFDIDIAANVFNNSEDSKHGNPGESQECRFARWLSDKGYIQYTDEQPAQKINLSDLIKIPGAGKNTPNDAQGLLMGIEMPEQRGENEELLNQYKQLVRAFCKARNANTVLPDYKAFTPFAKRALIAAHINDNAVTTALLTGPEND